MKLSELNYGDGFTGFFILNNASNKMTNTGKPYLAAHLADCSMTVECKAWDYPGPIGPEDDGKVVKVQGVMQEFKGMPQIKVERIRLPLEMLNGTYTIRLLKENDVPEMLRLARTNPLFYQYMRPDPTAENLAADLKALPPRRTLADKHFFGWFEGERLVAMMDLINHHPKAGMAFIGWFILDHADQGKGLGRRLVSEVLSMLKSQGVSEVRLGRIEGNPQSEHFWHVCGFKENGLGYDTEDYHVIVMAKQL